MFKFSEFDPKKAEEILARNETLKKYLHSLFFVYKTKILIKQDRFEDCWKDWFWTRAMEISLLWLLQFIW